MKHSILDISPDNYSKSTLHLQDRDWAETNCYVDVWIELLHSNNLDPLAGLAFTVCIDFEGDQWTFFKYPLSDLTLLYGIDVQELAIWKPLVEHTETQLKISQFPLIEFDSKYLPDTAGSSYGESHVKSTVAVNKIDTDKKYLEYFHAQGYYRLTGSDFDNVFKIDNTDASVLDPYVEIAKMNVVPPLEGVELIQQSIAILKDKIKLIPRENPFVKFKHQFEEDLTWLKGEELSKFHDYSFATFRQFGACFELSANYFQWLENNGEEGLVEIIECYRAISSKTKIYQFQLARAMMRNKPIDTSMIDELSQHWQDAVKLIKDKYVN